MSAYSIALLEQPAVLSQKSNWRSEARICALSIFGQLVEDWWHGGLFFHTSSCRRVAQTHIQERPDKAYRLLQT